ncbi:DUF6415 family natural product biosynthesis protein [Streptomyces sp. NPDC090073]|uniref:DUF6415 family natural product biosynthesis protein n=1 Tax=Streptomyces sp. NPDC090073 TaxID=3365936 RepID=UPI003812FCC3
MTHRTSRPSTAAGVAVPPPDIATMRAAARRLLDQDAQESAPVELETLSLQLRGHIQLLIPEVRDKASALPKSDIPRACALACIGEAEMRLRLGPGDNGAVHRTVVTKLARSVNALCDHFENLDNESP